ncbi:DUF3467 domain-containing protein [Capnocytophaga catalasegens]
MTVLFRFILTPHNAKRLLKALTDNVQKFEKSHGIIENEVPNSTFWIRR